MLPIYDSVRRKHFPIVNVTIVAINLIVFFYELALSQQQIGAGATRLDEFIFHWGNIPACMFDSLGVRDGLSLRATQLCASQPRPVLTLVSAMFIHGGWLHIIGNMLFLWIFGDNVEDAMGHVRYALFYLIVGIIAALTYASVSPDGLTPAIGASGAIAGVMGAYVVLYPRAIVAVLIFIFPVPLPAIVLIGFWFIMQLFSGFSSIGADAVGAGGGVAYFAHIGGFIAGALLISLFTLGVPRRSLDRRAGWRGG